MNPFENYKSELDLVRQNPSLLENYRFEIGINNSNHYERLRLNIAIYNDMKDTDYEIVRFLFNEERKWREYDNDSVYDEFYGDFENLYFSGFLLSLFKLPENIWIFWDTKNIDMDSSMGFDGEYLVSAGVKETYQYLNTIVHSSKDNILEYLGKTENDCYFTESHIERWREFKHEYFRIHKFDK
ncbi:MAG: hypothetical protein JNL32_05145 [Candidatus Kapabacteria bacterium]|nr:hypothetical protein [Candidatus Kapabacteria bacterium]